MPLLTSHVQAEVGVCAVPDGVAVSILLPGAGRSASATLTVEQAHELAGIVRDQAEIAAFARELANR